jgi:hypothetical protein
MTHGCKGCTHLKRYRSDLIAEGVVLGGDQDITRIEDNPAVVSILRMCKAPKFKKWSLE